MIYKAFLVFMIAFFGWIEYSVIRAPYLNRQEKLTTFVAFIFIELLWIAAFVVL